MNVFSATLGVFLMIHGWSQMAAVETRWSVSDPIFTPTAGVVSVKDPSIVHVDGLYHLFYTVHLEKGGTEIHYAAAPALGELNGAARSRVVAHSAAPQVFKHANAWYMICNGNRLKKNESAKLGSESDWRDVGQIFNSPVTGTNPVSGDEKANWAPIDFWMIADKGELYLFYALNNGAVGMTHQPLASFPNPNAWSEHRIAVAERGTSHIFEALHVYKSRADGRFYMQVEGMEGPRRQFALFTADSPSGTWNDPNGWKLVDGTWASGSNIAFDSGKAWTNQVSHPEAIRSGCSLDMEIDDINSSYWLFMGLDEQNARGKDYAQLPWHLGLMRSAGKGLPPLPRP